MFQDEQGGFARNPGDLSENELVGYQVAEHGDRDFRKVFHDLPEPLGFFEVLAHLYVVSPYCRGRDALGISGGTPALYDTIDFLTPGVFAPQSRQAWYPQR